jgi:hypothetical protein
MHRLNQNFLTQEKQIRIGGFVKPGEDPYKIIRPQDIAGEFDFDFTANVLNSSKVALQQGLEQLMGLYVTPLALQLGLSTPATIYRLLRDYGKAVGQNPDAYLQQPAPGSDLPPILVEEALTLILQGEMPQGPPLEGYEQHLQKLIEFQKTEEFGYLQTPEQLQLYRGYLEEVARAAQQARVAAQRAAAAEQFGPQGNGQPRRPGEATGATLVNENELLDESLPTAGGGGAEV